MGFEGAAYLVASVLGGAAAATIASKDSPKPPPPPPPPTPMPVADDQQVQDAQRRSLQAQLARRGRASTILSDPQNSDTLG